MRTSPTLYNSLAILLAGLAVFGLAQSRQVVYGASPKLVSASSVPEVLDIPSNNWAFPHVTLYGGGGSNGWPFTGVESDPQSGGDAPLNQTVINDYARFPMIIIPITPSGDIRPDILSALRQANPQQKVFAYVHSTGIWCPTADGINNSYPANAFYRQLYLAVTNGDQTCAASTGKLYLQNGADANSAIYSSGLDVNLAHRIDLGGGNYQYDVADRMATTIYSYAKKSNGYDGIFLDVFCPDIRYVDTLDPNHPYVSPTNFDYVKAGYGSVNNQASYDAFHAGWEAGQQEYAQKLRALAIADGQPNFPISGNCAQAPTRLQPYLNGWMREGFPFQNTYAGAADFYSNMFAWPWGYIHQDYNFLSPQYNFIFPPAVPDYIGGNGIPVYSPYNTTNQRKMRFGLGSASLGNGSVEFHDSSGNPINGLWYQWWYDEYGVRTDLPSTSAQYGQAIKDSLHNEWLGMPLGPAHAQLATTYATTPDLLTTNQDFETTGASPSQIPGWQFVTFAPSGDATIERDTTTAGNGNASAHVRVNTLYSPPISYSVNLVAGDFPITAGQYYSITFRAKADAPAPVELWFGSADGVAIQTLRVDTQWRQYQAVVHATQTNAHTHVQISMSYQSGDYWFDDVHVQQGATAVWRRDFEHGIVLVNPTPTSQSVLLEQPYQRIRGTVNPTLNDGSVVTQITIPGTDTGGGIGDSAFLLDLDITPPNAVMDLQASP